MGCTVGELLARIDSYELAEWEAFERAFGPLGNEYTQETLASILDTLNLLLHLTGNQYEENPIPVPTRHKRPPEVFRDMTTQDDEVMDRAEFDSQF